MKALAAVLLVLSLATTSSAQDLSNPDFESAWISGTPPGWSVLTTGMTAARDTVTHTCGNAACKLTTGNTTTAEFAKEWKTSISAIATGDVIMGKFRIKLPGGQAFGSGTAYVEATGVDSITGVAVGTQMLRHITPAMNWQEITAYYVVPTLPANGLTIHIGIKFTAMPTGINLWLDQVFFQGTSASFGALQQPLCPEPDFVIASQGLQYSLDAYNGSVKNVYDTLSSASYMPAAPTVLPLFELGAAGAENPSAPLITNTTYAHCIIRPPISLSPNWTVQTTTNVSTIPEASNIKVTVWIAPSSTSSDIAFSITVADTNGVGATAYDEFQCPVVKMPSTLGLHPEDDTVFIGGGDGWTVQGPERFTWDPKYNMRDYPGSASMQVEAFYDGQQGLCVEAHDTDGNCKEFGFIGQQTSTADYIQLVLRRRYPMLTGQTIASYPVVISHVTAPWENVASHYRAWARTQSWATSQKYRRGASWVHDRNPVYNASLEVMGNTVYLVDPAAAPGWGGVMDDWANALGLPMTTLFRNFEHYGVYAAPYYATARAELKPSNATDDLCWHNLLNRSHHTEAMVSGLKWLRARDPYPNQMVPCPPCTDLYWIQRFVGMTCDLGSCGSQNSVFGGCLTNGQVIDDVGNVIDTWDSSFTNASGPPTPAGKDVCIVGPNSTCTASYAPSSFWDGDHSWMCPRCKMSTTGPTTYVAAKVLGDLAALLASNGMQLYEFDQTNGGGIDPCYSTAPLHDGHPPGFGNWIYNAMVSTLQAIRDVRLNYPEFAMSMEDPGELYIPYLDCFLGRTNNVNSWPANGMPGALVVPAFEYVYSDLLPVQSTDLLIDVNNPGVGNITFNEQPYIVGLSRLFVSGGALAFEMDASQAYPYYKNTSSWAPISSHANTVHLMFLQHCAASLTSPYSSTLPYFDTGRMVSADGFSSPTFTYTEEVFTGLSTDRCNGDVGFKCVSHTVDSVNHSAWQVTVGSTTSTALVLVNVDRGHTAVSVQLPTAFDGVPVTLGYHVSINGGQTSPGSLPNLTLNQLDVAVVTYP